jgi:hypothetical protein
MVAHPDVDPGHVVGSEWWIGPAVGDVHGIHLFPNSSRVFQSNHGK